MIISSTKKKIPFRSLLLKTKWDLQLFMTLISLRSLFHLYRLGILKQLPGFQFSQVFVKIFFNLSGHDIKSDNIRERHRKDHHIRKIQYCTQTHRGSNNHKDEEE